MIVCADDYGLSEEISQGIRQLIEERALSATTCLMNFSSSSAELAKLRSFHGQIDVGLHLNFTEGSPLSFSEGLNSLTPAKGEFPPLALLFYGLLRKKISQASVQAEAEAQLKKFMEIWGEPPDFLDGHQHVHQLPVAREVFLSILQKVNKEKQVYARISRIPRYFPLNPRAVSERLAGECIRFFGEGLLGLCAKKKISTNRFLYGYHSYHKPDQLEKAFALAKKSAGQNDVFMVHPGYSSPNSSDPMGKVRANNLHFLLHKKLACPENFRTMNRFNFNQPNE